MRWALGLLFASTACCLSCSSGTRNIPLSPGGEPACLTPDGYVLAEREIDPRVTVRVMSRHETAFLADGVRKDYLFVQLSHTWTEPALEYRASLALAMGDKTLAKVEPTIESLAAVTGEKPRGDAQEAARDLIIWATGGVALFSDKVVRVPQHVQLLALLERQPCDAPSCE